MSHRIEWIVPDHLVIAYMDGLVLPAEVHDISVKLYNQIKDCASRSDSLVHLMIDTTHATIAPHVRDYMSIKFPRSENTGWSIITGSSIMIKMIISIFSTLIPNMQFVCFNTVEEGVAFLGKRDLAIESYLNQRQNSIPASAAPRSDHHASEN